MGKHLRLIVLTNAAAGAFARRTTTPHESIVKYFAEAGADAQIRPTPGGRLGVAAEAAMQEQPSAIVAAGGDGTISAVAGALAGSHVPLGVLPMGTLNHFCRDLGIPLNLPAAARIIAQGAVRAVDVAEVNGHRFINNSSIGLYPRIVRRRDAQCQRLGRGKWISTALAALSVVRRYPLVRVSIQADGRTWERKTPFLFIGNNRYHMNLLAMGARPRLDGQELSAYSTTRTGRFGLLLLMLRGLVGRLDQSRDFDDIVSRRLRVDTRKSALRVACDGEVLHLKPPLEYRILPGALKVLAPW